MAPTTYLTRVGRRVIEIDVEHGKRNYSAYSPDIPGCVATGKTEAQARRHLRAALRWHMEDEKGA